VTSAADSQLRWQNWAKTQTLRPRRVLRPKSLEELRGVVREVSGRGGRMKPVASGLSFSDILHTDDTLVLLRDLQATTSSRVLLPLEAETWRDPHPREPRVRVVCGAQIRALNQVLASAGLAFANLGGFDEQTLIGAISTSTHGSGIKLGPFPGMVRSLDLVTTGGVMYRIEPKTGAITDPDKFRARHGSEMTLVQNDDWFRSVVVSLGCMGVIYSAVVAVSPAYRLFETRRVANWSEVKRWLEGAITRLGAFRHYEVWVNPYPRRDGERSCLVTERRYAPPGSDVIPIPEARLRAEKLLFLPSSQMALLRLMNSEPRFVPTILETSLHALETDRRGHVDESYKVFHVGEANYARVLSGEYFFPLEGGKFIRAVDRMIEIVAQKRRRGIFQTGPLAMRFIDASDAYLSMLHGRRSCSVEIPVYTDGNGAHELILSYEEAHYAFDGRPHWGQMHERTGQDGFLFKAYPRAKSWVEVCRALNHRGIFDNHFTDRLGISVGAARPA
jgi:L-gulono-1,4-lactone dehydrogenase